MEKSRILVIEDEKRLAGVLKEQFEEEGFTVDLAYDGYVGKYLFEQNIYNLILLDINLPLINGYELCKEIRSSNSKVPIVMLTAMGEPQNKLIGFNSGADDYIVKPFDPMELMARVHACIRRNDNLVINDKLRISDLEMDLKTKSVVRGNKSIDLTAKEFELLETFLRNEGKLLSREYIIEHVWGIDFDPNTNIIDVYISYLRKKIDKDFNPKLIHTKFGFGFYISDKEL